MLNPHLRVAFGTGVGKFLTKLGVVRLGRGLLVPYDLTRLCLSLGYNSDSQCARSIYEGYEVWIRSYQALQAIYQDRLYACTFSFSGIWKICTY